MNRGVQIWYEWITLYYKLQALFTRFSGKSEYKADIQQLLQGGGLRQGRRQGARSMKKALAAIESDEQHAMRPFISGSVEVVEADV